MAKNGVQVTLCLNGYSLSLADGAEGCIIYLAVSDEGAEPSVLTITDCNGAGTSSNYYVGEAGELIFDDGSFAWQEAYIAANEKNALAGGRITGATAGAISVGDYNQLYLSGVNIIDNEGRYGAGVVIAAHAKAVIDSCVIAGNRLTGEMKASERQILGGGVYCAGELELCGTTNLTGNRAQDAQNNLWLDETGTVTIGALGLDKQARVGVSGQAEQAVLTGYADDFSENFTSDDPTLCISAVHENGFTDLQLQEAVYTLTLVTDENDEPVTLEAEQGKSLADLYVNDPEREDAAFDGWYTENEEFRAYWLRVMKEIIDLYQPELLYTDGALPFGEHTGNPDYSKGLEAVAYLYNTSIRANGENRAVYTQKERRPEIYRVGVLDVEKSQLPGVQERPWQTDTCIGNWFYDAKQPYKHPDQIIEMLIDIVSKNGTMLLNVLQRPDGTIDDEARYILEELATWFPICGEAIYGTRPWHVFGEGDTRVTIDGFTENKTEWNSSDYRFTQKDGALYAFLMKAPESGVAVLKSLAPSEKVASVELLGAGPVEFVQSFGVLTVQLPEQLPTQYTNCLKIQFA